MPNNNKICYNTKTQTFCKLNSISVSTTQTVQIHAKIRTGTPGRKKRKKKELELKHKYRQDLTLFDPRSHSAMPRMPLSLPSTCKPQTLSPPFLSLSPWLFDASFRPLASHLSHTINLKPQRKKSIEPQPDNSGTLIVISPLCYHQLYTYTPFLKTTVLPTFFSPFFMRVLQVKEPCKQGWRSRHQCMVSPVKLTFSSRSTPFR